MNEPKGLKSKLPVKPKTIAKGFPVVCVGGSAGGLDAYTRLLQNLPADMGVAIVIVNHLRTVATYLHKILPRYTEMPVELISEKLYSNESTHRMCSKFQRRPRYANYRPDHPSYKIG